MMRASYVGYGNMGLQVSPAVFRALLVFARWLRRIGLLHEFNDRTDTESRTWILLDREPPSRFAWGVIYVPNSVGVAQWYEVTECHAIHRRYSARVFQTVLPWASNWCGAGSLILEPGGEFGEISGWQSGPNCPHRYPFGEVEA